MAELPPKQTFWFGKDLVQNENEWIINLNDVQLSEICDAVKRVVEKGNNLLQEFPESSVETLITTKILPFITATDFPLPTLAILLKNVKKELLNGKGFVVIKRLPVEVYSPLERAIAFMGIGSYIGNSRSQNAKGHLLGHVYDLGLSSSNPNVRLYTTKERLTFHTDSCDVVGLLCLSEAKQGGDSLLVSAGAIYNRMHDERPDLLARLLSPMPHDRRGEVPAGQKPWFNIPVFSWYENYLSVFYQRQYFDSSQRFEEAPRLTAEDIEALNMFDDLTNHPEFQLKMRLEAGAIQFVHNHVLLHDRTAFENWPEMEKRRHLLRLWLSCTDARPLPEHFEARYGSVEIGNRGGIIVPGSFLKVPIFPE